MDIFLGKQRNNCSDNRIKFMITKKIQARTHPFYYSFIQRIGSFQNVDQYLVYGYSILA